MMRYCGMWGHLLLFTVHVINESQFCDQFFVVLNVTRHNNQLYLTLSFTTTLHVIGVRSEDQLTMLS